MAPFALALALRRYRPLAPGGSTDDARNFVCEVQDLKDTETADAEGNQRVFGVDFFHWPVSK